MSFIRTVTKGGRKHRQRVESYWDRKAKRCRTGVLEHLGPVDPVYPRARTTLLQTLPLETPHFGLLASILITEPSVLLLDEPTNGLGPAERVVIRNALVQLKREHRLILMSSHLLQEVTEICDHVIVIDQGRILLQDSVESIDRQFRPTSLEVDFTRATSLSTVEKVPGVPPARELSSTRFRLDFDGSQDTRVHILEGCQRLAPVASFSSATLTLEDAYMRWLQPSPTTSGPSPAAA